MTATTTWDALFARLAERPGERLSRQREGAVDARFKVQAWLIRELETLDAAEALLTTPLSAQVPHFSTAVHNLVVTLAHARSRLWQWHARLRVHVTPTSPVAVRDYLRQSWVVLARHALLLQLAQDTLAMGSYEAWPAALTRRAMDFAWVAALADHTPLVVAALDQVIGVYTVATLHLALQAMAETLDTYGWSQSASAYLHALFLRHALYVHAGPEEVAQEADADPAWLDSAEASALLPGGRLTSAWLDANERLLFHLLWRDQTLNSFAAALAQDVDDETMDEHALPRADPARLAEWRARAWPQLTAAMLRMLTHPVLSTHTINMVQTHYMARYVWAGEREAYVERYPAEPERDANAVLWKMRLETYTHLQQAYAKVAMRTVLERHEKQQRQWPPAGQSQASADPLGLSLLEEAAAARSVEQSYDARLVLLALEVAFDTDARTHQLQLPLQRHLFVHLGNEDYPRDVPPWDLETARASLPRDGWPFLCCLWHVFAVLVPEEAGVLRVALLTPHLPDAFALWLAHATRREGGQPAHLPMSAISGTWDALLAAFPLQPRDA